MAARTTVQIDFFRLAAQSCLFHCDAIDENEVTVASFEAREEVNRLFSVEVQLLASGTAAAVPDGGLLGRSAALSIHVPDMAPRTFHGVVVSAGTEQVYEDGRVARKLHLAPRVWLLTKRRQSRIFQGKTVREIVALLLDQAGVAQEWAVVKSYPKRPYCVQYEETDHDFIGRILAEEGIFYYFEEPADPASDLLKSGERIVFADTAAAYRPIPGGPRLVFRRDAQRGHMTVSEDTVSEISFGSTAEPTAVRVLDYDFRRPLLDLTSRVAREPYAGAEIEVYDHHGEHIDGDIRDDQASTQLEQLRANADVVRGVSFCRRLSPGGRVSLEGHEIDRLNGDYVITSVVHRGTTPDAGSSDARFEARFTWVPASVPVRPVRPRRLKQQVMECATVVGPPGQEIHTDALGRIKVQFPWDRDGRHDEHSSCFLRVLSTWAGDGFGFQFIPRIGMEVLVGFVGGDVDRPVVMGCLYNATHPVPNGLPALSTRSSIRTRSSPKGGGYNEIAFEDSAGNEYMQVHAERDLVEEVQRNRTSDIGGDASEHIQGAARSVVEGIREDRTRGDLRTSVDGDRLATIGGGDHVLITRDQKVTVGGEARLTVAGAMRTVIEGPRHMDARGAVEEICSSGRSTEVIGDDRRIVGGAAAVVVDGPLSLTARGGVAIGVGSAGEPSQAKASIAGDLTVGASGKLEIAIEKGVVLRVGKSIVSIGPEEVTIESPKVRFLAGSIEGASDAGTLTMGDGIELRGKKVKISSEADAILELGEEAKLDGKALKLNSKNTAEAQEAEKREEQAKDLEKVEVQLFDRDGNVISNAVYEVSLPGYLDSGVAASGSIEIPHFPDVEVCHVRWGRPEDAREEWATDKEYEFEMDVYLGHEEGAEQDVLALRKLSNLGYRGATLAEAVQSFQLALGQEPTGDPEDVRAALDKHHDDMEPVRKGPKAV